MDILKKMFQQTEEDGKENDSLAKDEFRKPQWFEEAETDDELFDDDRKFAFQIFTNPMELQKHFERQMQQILEAVSEMDGGDKNIIVEKNIKEDYLKPGFESEILKEFEKQKAKYYDTDLDGEIYPDQLHSLLQRFANGEGEVMKHLHDPETPPGHILPRNDNKAFRNWNRKPKMSDEEIIMGRIHGTLDDDESQEKHKRAPPPPAFPRRPDIMTPMTPMMPRGSFGGGGGAFEGTYSGPKMFSQSVMTKTIRKPDGTYETTKITQDSQGNKTTTITRVVDGKTETITTYDGAAAAGHGGKNQLKQFATTEPQAQVYSDRNVYVSKEGYALPRNLW